MPLYTHMRSDVPANRSQTLATQPLRANVTLPNGNDSAVMFVHHRDEVWRGAMVRSAVAAWNPALTSASGCSNKRAYSSVCPSARQLAYRPRRVLASLPDLDEAPSRERWQLHNGPMSRGTLPPTRNRFHQAAVCSSSLEAPASTCESVVVEIQWSNQPSHTVRRLWLRPQITDSDLQCAPNR